MCWSERALESDSHTTIPSENLNMPQASTVAITVTLETAVLQSPLPAAFREQAESKRGGKDECLKKKFEGEAMAYEQFQFLRQIRYSI